MATDAIKEFDVFLSYNWDVQPHVINLHRELTDKHGLKVWMDFYEMGTTRLSDELAMAILKSKIFICCITKKYTESKNCKNELDFAENSHKKIIVLMFERLDIAAIGGVGFTIGPLVRFNCYRSPDIFQSWTGNTFDSILAAIKSHLKTPKNSTDEQKQQIIKAFSEVSNTKQAQSVSSTAVFRSTVSILPQKETPFIVFKHPNLLANDSMELKNNPVGLTYKNSTNTSKKLEKVDKSVEESVKERIEPLEVKTKVVSQCYSKPPADSSPENTKKCNLANTVIELKRNLTSKKSKIRKSLLEMGFKEADVQVVLKSKQIINLDKSTFNGLSKIEGIYLYDNLLTDLENGTFNELPELNTISLEFNSINSIQDGLLNNLNNLQYLKLNCNQIKSIGRSAFNGLYNLRSLDLGNNLIKNIEPCTFGDLMNLLSLYLGNNLIKAIDRTSLSGLVSVESLDLHGNFIKRFQEGTFSEMNSLKYLDILENSLEAFDGSAKEFDNVEVSV